jgi:hypothetical protein
MIWHVHCPPAGKSNTHAEIAHAGGCDPIALRNKNLRKSPAKSDLFRPAANLAVISKSETAAKSGQAEDHESTKGRKDETTS